MSYLGVKYYLSKMSEEVVPQYFKVIAEKNGITVYENEATKYWSLLRRLFVDN